MNSSDNERKNVRKDPLREELEAYQKEKIRLYLQGRPSSPERIAKACHVSEGRFTYMRDYIPDEEGHITKIVFHRVRTNH